MSVRPMSSTEHIRPAEPDFLVDWVDQNGWLTPEQHSLMRRWLTDPTDRAEIAEQLGMSLGRLLRQFNETAPLSEPVPFRYRQSGFCMIAMAGTCDDIADGRFPMFGAPVTLRCYLDPPGLLPQPMLEAADWNFMDAGRPGFLGYLYGVRHDRCLYLAGLQSDVAVRYSYLFQAREPITDVRRGEDVLAMPAAELTGYGEYVPVLRRTFQRYWIQILLAAALVYAERDGGLDRIGLLQFPITEAEDVRGKVVHRVYRELPSRLNCIEQVVELADGQHRYAVATLAAVAGYLGDRLQTV